MRNRLFGLTGAMLLVMGLVLGGCAHRQASSADSKRSKDAVATHDVSAVQPKLDDDATIVFQSKGWPAPVSYSVSTSGKSCEGFDNVGRVFDSGRGTILPWIAKLTEKADKLARIEVSRTRTVKAGVPLQIRSISILTESTDRRVISEHTCGPYETTFIPQKGKTYRAEFVFLANERCEQHITDVTDSAATPLPVESVSQTRPICGRSAPDPDAVEFDAISRQTVCRTTLLTGKIGQSAQLCVSEGLFAHDLYELRIDGVEVAKGIDDETTQGVSGQFHDQAIKLTCQPQLDVPKNVTDAQIESVRASLPNGTHDDLKKLYLSLNSTEIGRHCTVAAQAAELFSVDVRFP